MFDVLLLCATAYITLFQVELRVKGLILKSMQLRDFKILLYLKQYGTTENFR